MSAFDVKVSIIVPVYQVQSYLNDCVNSLINQTYQNLEVILVDDGSTDDSGRICDEKAKADNRVKVIHQENQGVSAARNNGLRICTGQYIMFVDADDWISPNCCEVCLESIRGSNSDICYFEMNVVENEDTKMTSALTELQETDPNKMKERLLQLSIPFRNGDNIDDMVFYGPYCKFFRREILFDLYFLKDLKYGEDAIFNFNAICASERFCFIEQSLYYYRKNASSVTADFKTDRLDQSRLRLRYTYELICKTGYKEELLSTYREMFSNMIFWIAERLFAGKNIGIWQSWTMFHKLANDSSLQIIWKELHDRGNKQRALDLLFSKNIFLNMILFLKMRYC